MAKSKPNPFATGKMSPVKAAKAKHDANAVLGKNDSTYHSTGC